MYIWKYARLMSGLGLYIGTLNQSVYMYIIDLNYDPASENQQKVA